MIKLILPLLMIGCGVYDTVEGRFTSPGTVFVCEGRNDIGQTNEWCYNESVEDLEAYFGLDCHSSKLYERTSIVGCWYHCDDPSTPDVNEGEGSGCNAHNGCACI